MQVPAGGGKQNAKQRPTLITGGYEQDIQCLMDSEMIDEFLPRNSKFDKVMKAAIKANKDKSPEERLITKLQIYMILQRDNEDSTALHFACLQGSYLITFIIEQAKRLNVFDEVLLALDEQGRTPLFRLCQQGFFKKKKEGEEYDEHKMRSKYIRQLISNPNYDQESPSDNNKDAQSVNQIAYDSKTNLISGS